MSELSPSTRPTRPKRGCAGGCGSDSDHSGDV